MGRSSSGWPLSLGWLWRCLRALLLAGVIAAATGCATRTPVPIISATATPAGPITMFPLPEQDSYPGDMTVGPDGNIWFTTVYMDRMDQIGRITANGTIRTFPPLAGQNGIGLGELQVRPDRAVWFADAADNTIGRITTDGAVTEYAVPTARSRPEGLTMGDDGALWFTEDGPPSSIGRITEAGSVTDFPLPNPNSIAIDIVAGARGTLWFTDKGGNIGRITKA